MALKRHLRTIDELEVDVRPHVRATRLKLTADAVAGVLRVSCPPYTRIRDIEDFVRRNRGWIENQQARQPKAQPIEPGGTVWLHGNEITVQADGAVRGVVRLLEGATMVVPGAPESFERRVKDYFKKTAKAEFAPVLANYGAALHHIRPDARPLGRLTVRDTSSRWGSCAANGNISLSWRLIMAPESVWSYVIAHEVAHLAEPNHSALFWRVCRDLYGNTEAPQKWLKQYGVKLFQILP